MYYTVLRWNRNPHHRYFGTKHKLLDKVHGHSIHSIRSVQLFITKTTFYNIILYLQHTLYGNIMNAFKRGLFDCFHQIMKSLKFDYLKNIILFIYFLWRFFFFILILYPQIIGPRTMSWEQSIDQVSYYYPPPSKIFYCINSFKKFSKRQMNSVPLA